MQSLPRVVGILAWLLSVGAPSIEAAEQSDSSNRDMSSEITGKDGAAMLLIPAGDFMMGSSEGRDDEQPVHRVSLDAFYLDKYEVTNALFQKFVEKSNYETTAERQGPVAEGLACFRVANRERRGITV